MRLDGLDPLIMYGTGSHSGHTVTALRDDSDGRLYIVESQSGWYWPTDRIQRTLFADWMDYADAADFHVTWMPLSAESRTKFDSAKAWEWFRGVEGLPYGYHNFLYGWVDTPEQNWPKILGKDLIPVVFSLLERIDKNITDTFYTDALNKHLGVSGMNITEIAIEANKRGLNVSSVMGLTELDGWKYTGEYHDGRSMVCSAFVIAIWKAAGVFDGVTINAVEWAPKDVYQVDIFDHNPTYPQVCRDADPGN